MKLLLNFAIIQIFSLFGNISLSYITYAFIYIATYTFIYTLSNINLYTLTYMHAFIYTVKHKFVYTNIYVFIYTITQYIHNPLAESMYVYVCIFTTKLLFRNTNVVQTMGFPTVSRYTISLAELGLTGGCNKRYFARCCAQWN